MRKFVYPSIVLLLLLSFSGCVVKPGNATTVTNNDPDVTTVPNVMRTDLLVISDEKFEE